MPRVQVNDTNLYYSECGVGPPLLCLPGALGSGARDFAPQLNSWSRHFRVIAPDPRGYGLSRPPDRAYSNDFFQRDAEDMHSLMIALNCVPFYLAGWSDGANTAALLASMKPSDVIKLVIWGGNSFVSAEDVERLESIRDTASWSPRMRQSLELIYGDSLQPIWCGYLDCIREIHQTGGEICRSGLARVTCPALILHGGKDPLVPEFHPHAFQSGIARSELHIFDDGGHSIHLSKSEEFDRIVLPFLLSR